MASKLDPFETRAALFAEFLEKKFGKKADEITKEELLSLVQKDFTGKTANKTSVGSAGSLYRQYCQSKEKDGKKTNFLPFG